MVLHVIGTRNMCVNRFRSNICRKCVFSVGLNAYLLLNEQSKRLLVLLLEVLAATILLSHTHERAQCTMVYLSRLIICLFLFFYFCRCKIEIATTTIKWIQFKRAEYWRPWAPCTLFHRPKSHSLSDFQTTTKKCYSLHNTHSIALYFCLAQTVWFCRDLKCCHCIDSPYFCRHTVDRNIVSHTLNIYIKCVAENCTHILIDTLQTPSHKYATKNFQQLPRKWSCSHIFRSPNATICVLNPTENYEL